MGLLDGLEKLINEHGSAAILKERIDLANDKYAALERKLADTEQRLKQGETEKQGFELENYKLKEQVRTLEAKVADRQGQRLEEIREKLLMALSSGQDATADQLARHVSASGQVVKFHLEELQKADLVSASYFYTGQSAVYRLAQEGRRYLIANGLLK